MIKFACPSCGQRLNVPPAYAGKTAACPRCKAQVVVPSLAGEKKSVSTGGGDDQFGLILEMLDSKTPVQAPPPPTYVDVVLPTRPTSSKAIEAITLPFWLGGQVIGAFLRKFSIELSVLAVLAAVGGGIYWFTIRDKWEDENLPRLTQLKAAADGQKQAGDYRAAIDGYMGILEEVSERKSRSAKLEALVNEVNDAVRDSGGQRDRQVIAQFNKLLAEAPAKPGDDPAKYIESRSAILKTGISLATSNRELLDLIKRVREERDRAAVAHLRAQLKAIDEKHGDEPGARRTGYRMLLAQVGELPDAGVNVTLFRDHLNKLSTEVSQQMRQVDEYFSSIDPFLSATIPFLRRLRWGMPEGVFAQRVTDVVSSWRAIADPPDRTTAGMLLTHSNRIAAHIGTLEERRKASKPLNWSVYIELLAGARPVDIAKMPWDRKVDEYFTLIDSQITNRRPDGVLLPNVGVTISLTPEKFNELYDDLRLFERAFRLRYEQVMGQPYKGAITTIHDSLDARKRAAFNDSLEPFLEHALPTLRRLERGSERRVLLNRLVAMDQRLKAILDPPDDSDIGDVLISINQIARLLHQFAFVTQGTSGLDIVGQDQPESKQLNDLAESLVKTLRDRRNDPAKPEEVAAYAARKKAWLDDRTKIEKAEKERDDAEKTLKKAIEGSR